MLHHRENRQSSNRKAPSHSTSAHRQVIPIVLLGALLIWIPVAVLFVAAAVVSGLLRGRDSVPPSPAEAPASPPLAETTDAVRDERASQLVDRLSLWSGAAGLIPLPLVDMAAVGGVQLYMLRRLSEIYEIPFSENLIQPDAAPRGSAA